jgi:hypothetical protein
MKGTTTVQASAQVRDIRESGEESGRYCLFVREYKEPYVVREVIDYIEHAF